MGHKNSFPAQSFTRNPSQFAQNLLKKGILRTHKIDVSENLSLSMQDQEMVPPLNAFDRNCGRTDPSCYDTGGVWIDPQTYRVVQGAKQGRMVFSDLIYAVGAMVRGQILDAIMARRCVRATAVIADQVIDQLQQNWNN